MLKKLISVGLAIVLCVSFAGCGKKDETVELPDQLEQVADIFANADSFADDDVKAPNSSDVTDEDKINVGGNAIGSGGPVKENTGTENLVGNTYTKGFPYVKDPITLEIMVYSRENSAKDWSQMRFSKVYEDATNIKVKWTVVPQSSLRDKVKIMMAAGNYPDVLCGLSGTFTDAEVLSYGAKGVFWDMSQSLKTYAPNIYSLMSADKSIRTACIEANGSMFSLPFLQTDTVGHYWNINKKWLDNLGLKVPTTTEELEKVLIAFKNNDPDGDGINNQIPFAGYCHDPSLFGPWGLYFEWNNQMHIDNNGKVEYIFSTPEARAAVLYWKNLSKQGLIDIPMYGGTVADFNKKLQTGKVGAFMWNLTPDKNCLDYDMLQDYIVMDVPVATSGVRDTLTPGMQRHDPKVSGRSSFIFNTCKNKEAALRWLDYFYSVEGNLFKSYCDVGYKYLFQNADGSLYVKVPAGANPLEDAPGSIIAGNFTPAYNASLSTPPGGISAEDKYRNDYSKKAYEIYKDNVPKYMWQDICYTLEESKEINKYKMYLTFDSGWYTMCAMILGKSDVADPSTGWNTWLNTLKKAGLEQFVAVQQKAYDRTKNG